MNSRASRNTAASPIPAILAVSVVVHAAVIYFGFDHSPSQPYVHEHVRPTASRTAGKKVQVMPINPTCTGDVVLAAAGRSALCLTGVRDTPASCLAKVKTRLSLDLLSCSDIDETPPPSVALLNANSAALRKLKPMPILPLLRKAKQRAFEKKAKKKIEKKLAALKKRERYKTASARIVEITKPDVEMAPKKTHRVSEFNSRVKQETVARASTEKMVSQPGAKELKSAAKATKNVAKAKPDKDALKGDANDPKVVAKEDNDPTRSKTVEAKKTKLPPGLLSMRDPTRFAKRRKLTPGAKNGRTGRTNANGIVPRKGNGRRRVAARTLDPARRGTETSGKAGMRKRVPNLLPSKELLRRVVGGGSVDKLNNVKAGEVTALNARRWKFASFFNRLKRQVAQNWHPDRVYLRRDPQGNVYGSKDRITVLRVRLNKDGSVGDVIISKVSGVGFLDDEAERAFRAAGPFPNPPVALLSPKKDITFVFGFHFQIGSRRDRWKIFRYR